MADNHDVTASRDSLDPRPPERVTIYRGDIIGGRPNPDDYEWSGEYDTITTDDWWCPSEDRWSMCPGPCPDGREHGPKRTTKNRGKVMVLKSESARRAT